MERVRPWLLPFTWEIVTAQNFQLCAAKHATHGPTLDGHEATMTLWQSRHQETMSLDDAVDLCRCCHRMAPFCFYNGNTFASIIGLVIRQLPLDPAQAQVLRSLAGHIVAGVADDWELTAFSDFCATLE